MFKKTLIFILVVMALSLMSCNSDHSHDFADDWSSDEDMHWRACTVEGCTSTVEKADHDFEENADGTANVCKTCGYKADLVGTAPDHEHVFSEEVSYNDNYHWYACTVEGCIERDSRNAHQFSNPEITQTATTITRAYSCVDCDYKKTETLTIEAEVKDETTWADAFTNLNFENFTAYVNFYYSDDEVTEEQTNRVTVTENSVYYLIEDYVEFYSAKNSAGTYDTYIRKYDYTKGAMEENFTLLNDKSDRYYLGGSTEAVINLSFANHFDSFVFDEATGTYSTEEVIAADCHDFAGSLLDTLNCYNISVKVADNKINYINLNYYFDPDDPTLYTLNYYNIGMTSLSIPQNVIENALPDDGKHNHYEDNNDYENSGNTGSDNTSGEEYSDTAVPGNGFNNENNGNLESKDYEGSLENSGDYEIHYKDTNAN